MQKEQFTTIWDVTLEKSKRVSSKGPASRTATAAPIKEVFLTIWDSVKRKPAA